MSGVGIDAPGSTQLFIGNEAIARGALEAGIGVASAYPGTPSTEIMASLISVAKEMNFYAEWSVNEKVALEGAIAFAWSGLRVAVVMKQVGLNVAADPLMSSAYTGTVGGFLIISCDDPGPHSSQTEQDTREFARFAKLPVLDPSSPEEARDMVAELEPHVEGVQISAPFGKVDFALEVFEALGGWTDREKLVLP